MTWPWWLFFYTGAGRRLLPSRRSRKAAVVSGRSFPAQHLVQSALAEEDAGNSAVRRTLRRVEVTRSSISAIALSREGDGAGARRIRCTLSRSMRYCFIMAMYVPSAYFPGIRSSCGGSYSRSPRWPFNVGATRGASPDHLQAARARRPRKVFRSFRGNPPPPPYRDVVEVGSAREREGGRCVAWRGPAPNRLQPAAFPVQDEQVSTSRSAWVGCRSMPSRR